MRLSMTNWLAGLDSPIWDRGGLTIEKRTAADDLAEFGAGSNDQGGVDTEEGTLLDDVKDFDLDAGYHDEPPEGLEDEGEAEPQHDWKKRLTDTQTSLHQKANENAALKAQLEALQRERMQPAQPNILQPGQQPYDPLVLVDQEYESLKDQKLKETMNRIRTIDRTDPKKSQEDVARLWAKHSEDLAELAVTRNERKAAIQADFRRTQEEGYIQNRARALQEAGYDPSDDQSVKEFMRHVYILNGESPNWDRGMDPVQTFTYVTAKMKENGVSAPRSNSPLEQHQRIRQQGAGALKAGTRTDPQRPKSKIPEEKDISFVDQIRLNKRQRTVTPEMALKLKQR